MMRFIFTLFCLGCLLLPAGLLAQTGPGGLSTANNTVWLRADYLSLSDDDSVSTWVDTSGTDNDATQSGTARPVYKTNQINGLPIVRFNGTNSSLTFTNHITDENTTYFAVFNRSLTVTAGYLFAINKYRYISTINNSSTGVGPQFSSFLQAGSIAASTNAIVSGTSNSSNTTIDLAVNGATFTRTRGTFTSLSSSVLGSNWNGSSAANFMNGDIAEFIFFNTALSEAERLIAINYLAAKYNISISNDLFAYQSTHSNDVAGIGQTSDGSNTTARGDSDLEISAASSLDDGDYMLFGHDNGGFATSSNTPSGVENRWTQTWRVDQTNDVGTVTVKFFLNANSFATVSNYGVLIDSVDSDFSNGDAYLHTTGLSFNAGEVSVSFTGVDIPDGSYITLGASFDDVSSVGDGDWNQGSTWNCNCLPTLNDEVTINSGHTVTIDSTSTALDLIISGGGTLTFSGSDTLEIYNSLSNAATFTAGSGYVAAKGTGSVSITNTSGNTMQFANFLNDNSGTTTLSSGGSFSISGTLLVNSGTFTNSATNFTFLSDVTSTAIIGNSAGSITGSSYIFERYIPVRSANWANVGSPVSSTTIADWDGEFYMSLDDGDDGYVRDGVGGTIWYSVFKYNNGTQAYDTVKSGTESVSTGQGFEFWIASDGTQFDGDTTLDSRGTPNSGNNVVLIGQGWNLLANPFQAFVTWNNVDKGTSGLSNDFYIFDAGTGNYALSSGGDLPPHQGFWVRKVIGGTHSVTFEEADKTTSTASTFTRKKSLDYFTLQLSNDENSYHHQTQFEINPTATLNADPTDGFFRRGFIEEAPYMYSASEDNEALILNRFNYEEELSIPITVGHPIAANYQLDLEHVDLLMDHYSCINLVSVSDGVVYDLTKDPSIEFKATGAGEKQFQLMLNNSTECEKDFTDQPYGVSFGRNNGMVDVYFNYADDKDAVISIYSITGQKLVDDVITNTNVKKISLNQIPTGQMVLLSVQVDGETFNEKIIR